jgi:deoxycytidylate deaminase
VFCLLLTIFISLASMRSKDPSTQVGACIVDSRKRIVGIGYNGFPTGCSDDVLPWARVAEDELDTKYPYVVHAEVNAILNKISAELIGCSVSICRIYVLLTCWDSCWRFINVISCTLNFTVDIRWSVPLQRMRKNYHPKWYQRGGIP